MANINVEIELGIEKEIELELRKFLRYVGSVSAQKIATKIPEVFASPFGEGMSGFRDGEGNLWEFLSQAAFEDRLYNKDNWAVLVDSQTLMNSFYVDETDGENHVYWITSSEEQKFTDHSKGYHYKGTNKHGHPVDAEVPARKMLFFTEEDGKIVEEVVKEYESLGVPF